LELMPAQGREHGVVASRVLVIEDDDRIRETTRFILEDEGFEVAEAATGEEGLERFWSAQPACVVIDLMLPGIDGFEVCRRLRQRGDVPIVVLTARTDTHDIVAGLEVGADDYLTKPFHGKELVARIRALLRRVQGGDTTRPMVVLDELEFSPTEAVLRKHDDVVQLTKTEFRLLSELAGHPGRIFTREMLLERVWGYDQSSDSKLLDTHVHRLRSKIEDDPSHPRHLLTVRGLGYKLV
jgi:DNA-binding response OmpR family regulator